MVLNSLTFSASSNFGDLLENFVWLLPLDIDSLLVYVFVEIIKMTLWFEFQELEQALNCLDAYYPNVKLLLLSLHRLDCL